MGLRVQIPLTNRMLSLVFVVRCLVSGLCEAFITPSGAFFRVIMSNCVRSTGVLISPQPDQEGNKLIFLSEWREFTSASCLAGKRNLMTARVSMLLKWRASLTCFRACFLPGRAKDLSVETPTIRLSRPEIQEGIKNERPIKSYEKIQ